MALAQIQNARHGTLVPDEVEVIQFLTVTSTISIHNRSSLNDLYYRTDQVDPIVGGDDAKVLVPGQQVFVNPPDSGNAEVRLKSVAANPYSVEKVV